MTTLTQKLLARCEYLKDAYATLIEEGARYNADTWMEYTQWRRLNGIIQYLESRLAR